MRTGSPLPATRFRGHMFRGACPPRACSCASGEMTEHARGATPRHSRASGNPRAPAPARQRPRRKPGRAAGRGCGNGDGAIATLTNVDSGVRGACPRELVPAQAGKRGNDGRCGVDSGIRGNGGQCAGRHVPPLPRPWLRGKRRRTPLPVPAQARGSGGRGRSFLTLHHDLGETAFTGQCYVGTRKAFKSRRGSMGYPKVYDDAPGDAAR